MVCKEGNTNSYKPERAGEASTRGDVGTTLRRTMFDQTVLSVPAGNLGNSLPHIKLVQN